MLKSKIYPESYYTFKELSRKQVILAKENGTTIIGCVTGILAETEEVEVKLGQDLFGYLPFAEVTIYPLKYSAHVTRAHPIQIEKIRNKNICVKVTDVTDDKITLSRKQNMLEAFEHLRQCEAAYFHISNVEQAFAYGDIGAGLSARIYIREISRNHLSSVCEKFHKDDTVLVAILDVNENRMFELSYKRMFRPYNPDDYKPGDPIECQISLPVDEMHSGYYASVTPQVRGIVDTTEALRYGDKVLCSVNRTTEKGLKLRLLKVLERKDDTPDTTD